MATATKTTNRISGKNGKADAKGAEVVQMKKLVLKEFDLPITGTTPLIVHRFSEKARKAIEDKQQQKAKGGKEKRDPNAEYLAALYVLPGTGKAGSKTAKYGIPAAGFKNAAVSACRFVDGIPMTLARGAFQVIESVGGLIPLKHDKGSPSRRDDPVRLSGPGNSLDMRYRPEFTEWSCMLRICYNATVISPEQIVNLFSNAGFGIGMCEWRPEKNGSYGMFEVPSQ